MPDDAGAGEALARALRAAGTEVITVTGGNAFTETPGGFTIDPASPADHAALAERLTTSAGVTVVDLRLLDRPEDGDGRDHAASRGAAARRLGRGGRRLRPRPPRHAGRPGRLRRRAPRSRAGPPPPRSPWSPTRST
ncbi:KR prefix domain-containing protein [Nonomuraea dietziae]|uniref:KR prefix domain-containing protein n=1 Tax=Nonomuraea dietziae TaxID=65515 RepID=UPI003CD0AAC9